MFKNAEEDMRFGSLEILEYLTWEKFRGFLLFINEISYQLPSVSCIWHYGVLEVN